MQQRKLAVDLSNLQSVSAANSFNGFFNAHVEDEIASWVEQIFEAIDVPIRVHKFSSGKGSDRRKGKNGIRTLVWQTIEIREVAP